MGCAEGPTARSAPRHIYVTLKGRLVREDDKIVTIRVAVADNAYCARGEKLPIIVEALLAPGLSNTDANEVRLR